MKKIIKITENDIKEIVKNAINEISYRKAYETQSDEGHKFKSLKDEFDSFYNDLLYKYGNIQYPTKNTFQYEPNLNHDNKYLAEIMKHASIINDILEKKIKQADRIDDRINDFDASKYYDSEEGQEEDYEDKELNYLINKYPLKNENR